MSEFLLDCFKMVVSYTIVLLFIFFCSIVIFNIGYALLKLTQMLWGF